MASRIDDSHHPFKRKKSEGPGPKKRPRVYQTDNWEDRAALALADPDALLAGYHCGKRPNVKCK